MLLYFWGYRAVAELALGVLLRALCGKSFERIEGSSSAQISRNDEEWPLSSAHLQNAHDAVSPSSRLTRYPPS